MMMMNKNVAYLLLWGIICCAALVGASDMLNPQVERARPDSTATTAIAATTATTANGDHFPPLGSGRFPHYQQKSKMIQHFERLLEQRSSSFSPENPPPDVKSNSSPPLDVKQIYAEVAHLGKGLSELGQLYKQSNQRNMELFHEMLECHKRQQKHNARFELQLQQQNQKGTRESAARASTRKPPKTANIALPVLLVVVAVVVPAILLGQRVLHTKRRRRVTSPSLLRK